MAVLLSLLPYELCGSRTFGVAIMVAVGISSIDLGASVMRLAGLMAEGGRVIRHQDGFGWVVLSALQEMRSCARTGSNRPGGKRTREYDF
jgi:hypothetical protein